MKVKMMQTEYWIDDCWTIYTFNTYAEALEFCTKYGHDPKEITAMVVAK